jgi:hypothetical protein
MPLSLPEKPQRQALEPFDPVASNAVTAFLLWSERDASKRQLFLGKYALGRS